MVCKEVLGFHIVQFFKCHHFRVYDTSFEPRDEYLKD